MTTLRLQTLEALAAQRKVVAKREESLVKDLSGALRALGYELVPTVRDEGSSIRPRATRRAARARRPTQALSCPHCSRRFAQPMHLARHVNAMHVRKRAAAKKEVSTQATTTPNGPASAKPDTSTKPPARRGRRRAPRPGTGTAARRRRTTAAKKRKAPAARRGGRRKAAKKK